MGYIFDALSRSTTARDRAGVDTLDGRDDRSPTIAATANPIPSNTPRHLWIKRKPRASTESAQFGPPLGALQEQPQSSRSCR